MHQELLLNIQIMLNLVESQQIEYRTRSPFWMAALLFSLIDSPWDVPLNSVGIVHALGWKKGKYQFTYNSF